MRLKIAQIIVTMAAVLPSAAGHSAQAQSLPISAAYEVPELAPSHAASFSTPLIDLATIKPLTRLDLQLSGNDLLRVKYIGNDGARVEQQIGLHEAGCIRNDQAIVCETVVPNVGARILPGISTQLRRITYRRDPQGDLQVIRNHIEKGWVLFAIPFHEDHESSLTLKAIR